MKNLLTEAQINIIESIYDQGEGVRVTANFTNGIEFKMLPNGFVRITYRNESLTFFSRTKFRQFAHNVELKG